MSATELRAWTSFLDAGRMIEERLSDQLQTEFGVTHREYEVLVRLNGHGGSVRMSVLATQMVASGPLISQTVSRLEERGWVTREPIAGDRRGVAAVLTDAGQSALASASGAHASLVHGLLLSRMADNELAVFAAALGDVADHLRSHRRGERCDLESCPLN